MGTTRSLLPLKQNYFHKWWLQVRYSFSKHVKSLKKVYPQHIGKVSVSSKPKQLNNLSCEVFCLVFLLFLLFDRVKGAKLCYKAFFLERTRWTGAKEERFPFTRAPLACRVLSLCYLLCELINVCN